MIIDRIWCFCHNRADNLRLSENRTVEEALARRGWAAWFRELAAAAVATRNVIVCLLSRRHRQWLSNMRR